MKCCASEDVTETMAGTSGVGRGGAGMSHPTYPEASHTILRLDESQSQHGLGTCRSNQYLAVQEILFCSVSVNL